MTVYEVPNAPHPVKIRVHRNPEQEVLVMESRRKEGKRWVVYRSWLTPAGTLRHEKDDGPGPGHS